MMLLDSLQKSWWSLWLYDPGLFACQKLSFAQVLENYLEHGKGLDGQNALDNNHCNFFWSHFFEKNNCKKKVVKSLKAGNWLSFKGTMFVTTLVVFAKKSFILISLVIHEIERRK